ncbi:cytochrome P450 [Leptodontidium sp. 2 PMI_412]|nr:cytochrome P450 [Leptodontidium sp. 2 PMI_412]
MALKVYEDRISKLLDDLEGRFRDFAKSGEAFDMPTWIEHLLFDAIGKIAFNVDFHSIEQGTTHFYVDFIHSTLSFIASFANISWIKPVLAILPTDKKTSQDMANFMAFSREQLTNRIQTQGSAEIDALGFLMAAGERKPAYKLTIPQLAAETNLIIAAGSDTTSVAILSAMYWLANDKAAYQKLRAECLTMFGPDKEFDASKLGDPKRALYLNACISEALRLMPSGPNGMQRVVNTAGGIMVNDIYVSEGTKVNVHPGTLYHDARCASIPFALGAYSCIRKNLALMQIRMFLMKVVPIFDFETAPGFDKRSFIKNTKSFFGLRKKPWKVFAIVHSQ